MESFEQLGYWWLPDDPDTKIPGKLSFDPVTGGVLELMGHLGTAHPFSDNLGMTYEIIHGFVKGANGSVTLCDSILCSSAISNTFTETKLRVKLIYRGIRSWFDKTDDIAFERIVVGYTYLNDWIMPKNFRSDWTHHNYRRVLTYDLHYASPEPIEISLDNAKIEIESQLSSNNSKTEVSLKNEYRFVITPPEKLHVDDFLEFVFFYLRNFLTLATGQHNYPQNIVGVVSDDLGGVRIYYELPGYVEKDSSITSSSMLFSFEDVRQDLPKYLSKWISNYDTLRPVYDLFFYVQSDRRLALQTSFLSLTQVLEGFHRIVCGGAYLTPEEYQPVKQVLNTTITEAFQSADIDNLTRTIDADSKRALLNKIRADIKYSYEYSLRTRIRDICETILTDYFEIVHELIGKPRDFAHIVTKARNALTHPDTNAEKNELSPSELFKYVQRMEFLIRLCFLKEMGFPPDEVKRLFHANQEYQYSIKKNLE